MRECLPIHSDMGSYPVSCYELFYLAATRRRGPALTGYVGNIQYLFLIFNRKYIVNHGIYSLLRVLHK